MKPDNWPKAEKRHDYISMQSWENKWSVLLCCPVHENKTLIKSLPHLPRIRAEIDIAKIRFFRDTFLLRGQFLWRSPDFYKIVVLKIWTVLKLRRSLSETCPYSESFGLYFLAFGLRYKCGKIWQSEWGEISQSKCGKIRLE